MRFFTFNCKIAHNFNGECTIFASLIVYLVNREKLHIEFVKITHIKGQKCAILHITIFSEIILGLIV